MLDLVQEADNYSNHSATSKPINSYTPQPQKYPAKTPLISPNDDSYIRDQLKAQAEEEDQSWSRLLKLKYYEQYFKVSQKDILTRIKSAIILPFANNFIDLIQPNPDFYGPVWLQATIVILLGTIGNFSNYLYSKFNDDPVWDNYIFKLEYIRQAFFMVYMFAIGVPFLMYFAFKAMDNKLKLADLICTYGYANACFIPAILLCILPFGLLQWIFMLYAFSNSTLFLIFSLKKHTQGLKAKSMIIMGSIACIQLTLVLLSKLIFLS